MRLVQRLKIIERSVEKIPESNHYASFSNEELDERVISVLQSLGVEVPENISRIGLCKLADETFRKRYGEDCYKVASRGHL